MEDVPLGEGVVVVVGAELRQCPIGDVFAAVCAVFVVECKTENIVQLEPKPPVIMCSGMQLTMRQGKAFSDFLVIN